MSTAPYQPITYSLQRRTIHPTQRDRLPTANNLRRCGRLRRQLGYFCYRVIHHRKQGVRQNSGQGGSD
jgi:hypothetical protein